MQTKPRSNAPQIIAALLVIAAVGLSGVLFTRWWRARLTTVSPTPSPFAILPTATPMGVSIIERQIPEGTTLGLTATASGSGVLRYQRRLLDLAGTIVVSEEYSDSSLGAWIISGTQTSYLGAFREGKAGVMVDFSVPVSQLPGKMIVALQEKTTANPGRILFETQLSP